MTNIDKAVLDFSKINDAQETDVAYIIRGVLEGRDKFSYQATTKVRDRQALEVIFGKASIISQESFVITGNSSALISSDSDIKLLLQCDLGGGLIPLLYTVPTFTDVGISTGTIVADGTTINYLYLEFDDSVIGTDAFTLHTSTTAPVSNEHVVLATYTATGTVGTYVFTFNDLYPNGSLLKDFEDGNNGTETTPDSFFGKLGKLFRDGVDYVKATNLEIANFISNILTVNTIEAEIMDCKNYRQQTPYGLTTLGNLFNLSDIVGRSGVTALSATRIALYFSISGSGLNSIATYDFDGTDWALVGNVLTTTETAGSIRSVAALSSDRIACYRNGYLSTYDFDGTDWALVGNPLNGTVFADGHITALSEDKILSARWNGNAGTPVLYLEVYSFDGTDWSLFSDTTTQSIVISRPCVCALESNKVIVFMGSENVARIYSVDGTTIRQIGEDLPLSGTVENRCCALSSNTVLNLDSDGNNVANFYKIDNGVPNKLTSNINITPALYDTVCTLEYNKIVYIDSTNDTIQAYTVNFRDLPPNPAFGTL